MQARFKRFTALIMSVLMVLTCMPMSAMAEDAVIPAEDISVEVIPEDAEAVPEQETATVMDTETSEPESDPVSETLPETEVPAEQVPAEETPSASETVPETETSQEEVPQEEPTTQSEETQPAEATKIPISTGMKYQLAECPFDSSHKHGDAAVFAYSNGSYGFHCFHNSCAGYHWHEFREKVDPSAYANSPYTVHQAVSTGAPSRSQPGGAEGSATAVKTGQPRMLDFAEIPNYDRSKIVVIRSRFQALDAKIGGFNKGEMTVWSGGNASGKSTLVSQIGLAAITEGFKVAMFSGEMTASRVREWVLLQAAGPDFVMQDPLNQNHYCLKPGIEEKLDAMLTGKLSIYDNDFGTDWEVVTNTIYDWVKKNEASVVIIDNLMALDIPTGSMDKYDMQTRIVKRFSAMAKELNVHVHFICHPRKTEAFPRKGDISGTADITNAADNVLMVHRVNADFMMRYKTVYPKLVIEPDVSTVIEVMKNRDLGIVDEIIKLYFDRRSRTMSDVKGLPPQHAWTEKIEQMTMPGFTEVDDPDLPKEWR